MLIELPELKEKRNAIFCPAGKDFLPSSSFHLSILANKFLCSLLTDDLPGGKRVRTTGTSAEAHEAGV